VDVVPRHIGRRRCPIVDTWWQTETGAIMISPIPGAVATKPGSCTLPLPGIDAAIVDAQGQEVQGADAGGFLVIRKPWPAMLRTIWGDNDATCAPTGRPSRTATTSRATARIATRMAISGSWAASTTC
jgi:acyl-coenzyme A synthetase/AMP-(fatty) acid ligase